MDRESFRAEQVAAIPASYSALLHVLAPSTAGLLTLAACVYLVHDVTWLQLLTVPVVLVLANMTEWRIHRDWLHKRQPPMHDLYDRHTPVHHRIYVYGDMEVRSWKEMKLVLIPAWAAVALFVGLLPLAAALYFLVAPNVAYFFMASCMLYVVTYEMLHASYHLPKDHPLGRNAIVRTLARHHSIHHHPPLMQKWNMNVSIPLWDIVRGTKVGEEAVVRADAKSDAASTSTDHVETVDDTTVGTAGVPG